MTYLDRQLRKVSKISKHGFRTWKEKMGIKKTNKQTTLLVMAIESKLTIKSS